MKNILAENMLRFGTKNLNESLKNLLEQQVQQTSETNLEAIPMIGVAMDVFGDRPVYSGINKFAKQLVSSGKVEEKTQYDLIGQLESNPLYSKLLVALNNAPGKKGLDNATIWFKSLNQESRLTFLNQFTTWWNESSKRTQKGKKTVVAILGKAGSGLEKIETVPVTQQPTVIDPLATMSKGSTTYIDNKSDITPVLRKEIDSLIASAKQLVDVAKSSGGTVTCNKLKVASSASRFRNTGEAANMTWADLSKSRGQKVAEAVKAGLQKVGVILPPNVTVELLGGTNGDGTSGPNPPKSLGQLTTDGRFNSVITDEKTRNKFGKPHANKTDYDQYKFCIIECELQPTVPNVPTPVVPEYEYKRFKTYEMRISSYEPKKGPGGSRTRDFDVIEWKIPFEKMTRARKEMLACKEPN